MKSKTKKTLLAWSLGITYVIVVGVISGMFQVAITSYGPLVTALDVVLKYSVGFICNRLGW